MSKTRWMLAGVAAVGLMAGLARIGEAQPAWGHGHGGGGLLHLLHGISLSDEQKNEVHTLLADSRSANKETFTQLRAIHQQIETELLSSDGDAAAKVASLEQQAEPLEAKLHAAWLNTALQVRGVLTTEQLAQAASKHAQLEALHEQERAVTGGATDEAR